MRATRVRATSGSIALETLHASAIRIPTDDPQADGTLEWDATTLVVAESTGGGERGLGYSYGDAAAAFVIRNALAPAVEGLDPMPLPRSIRESRGSR